MEILYSHWYFHRLVADFVVFFFFQAEDGIRDWSVTGVQTCALPICAWHRRFWTRRGRHHFVILVGTKAAGFALVRDRAHFAGAGVREVSEFFVLRKYRRGGVGSYAAHTLFRSEERRVGKECRTRWPR